MKKTKIIALIAALLVAVMLLASCAGSTVAITDLIDTKATYAADNAYSKGELLSNLTDATYSSYQKNLVYFTAKKEEGTKTYDQHIIYNVETNQIVLTLTETNTTDITVSLKYGFAADESYAYVSVNTSTWTLDAESLPDVYTYTTALYDAVGTKVAEAAYTASPVSLYDLVYFDGKIYSVGENDALTYAFDYSPLADMPNVDTKIGDKYYTLEEDEYVAVYDSQLKFISRYNLPAYAYMNTACVLGNGNILLQYVLQVEDHAEKYTFMTTDETGALAKYDLVTLVVNAEKGTAKEVDCEYLLAEVSNMADEAETMAEYGLKAEELAVYGTAVKIEDQRIPDMNDMEVYSNGMRMVTIDNKGSVSEIEKLNGETVYIAMMVASDRWVVTTEENRYLINGKGEILGSISNAYTADNFLRCDGKIYDWDLNVIYDFRAAKLTHRASVGDSLLFENQDDEILLYTGGSATTTIVAKDTERSLYYTGDDYYVIRDKTVADAVKYEFYNAQGTLLMTVDENSYMDGNYFSGDFSERGRFEDFVILSTTNADGDTVYYRLG